MDRTLAARLDTRTQTLVVPVAFRSQRQVHLRPVRPLIISEAYVLRLAVNDHREVQPTVTCHSHLGVVVSTVGNQRLDVGISRAGVGPRQTTVVGDVNRVATNRHVEAVRIRRVGDEVVD